MSSGAPHEDIARLMRTLNLEIAALPDHLRCTKCQSVLKDACQVPCGCRFCRICIDDVVASGGQFCPGDSQECGETSLSTALPDYGASRSISRLTTQCPQPGCSHECPLVDMEGHLRVCSRKSVDCPFRELGCQQAELSAEEMRGHLQQETRGHNEMLIRMVASINRDMELLKRELMLKDEQIRHVENENKSIKNKNKLINVEIKSIKDDNTSIKRDKEVLCERVRQMSEQLEREIDERCNSHKLDSARIAAISSVIGSNRDALGTEMKPLKDDILSINRDLQSIRGDIDCMKCQLRSTRVSMGLGQVDACCDEWLILLDINKTYWYCMESDTFTGAARPYTYRLASWNYVNGGVLYIQLRILTSSRDSQLEWPFRGAVTVSVSNHRRRDAYRRLTRQCRIEKPPDNQYRCSDPFKFLHSELEAAGLDLVRGVRVSCQIVPGEDKLKLDKH